MKYATDTSVSVAKTRGEIEDLVTRSGASRFFSGAEEGRAFVGFVMRCNPKPCPDCTGDRPPKYRSVCDLCSRTGKVYDSRNVMFELPLPKADAFRLNGNRQVRRDAADHRECVPALPTASARPLERLAHQPPSARQVGARVLELRRGVGE
jgi:hypothetical protein